VKMFDAGKTRMIGLPYGEKNCERYVKPFSSDTGTQRTDGLICYINIASQYARSSPFYRATLLHSADYAVARCPSVRLSVRPSVC